jgi:hypothetical protein
MQPPPQSAYERVNVASTLPRALWMEIFSYTHRNWFDKPHSKEAWLRRRLQEEQEAHRRSQEARYEMETRLRMAERERDIYRLLAMRWHSRLQSVRRREGAEDATDSLMDVLGDDPEVFRLHNLSTIVRRMHQRHDNSDSDDDVEGDGGEGEDAANENAADTFSVNDMDEEDVESDIADASDILEANDGYQMDDDTESDASLGGDMHVPESMTTESMGLAVRPQLRTVSFAGDNL